MARSTRKVRAVAAGMAIAAMACTPGGGGTGGTTSTAPTTTIAPAGCAPPTSTTTTTTTTTTTSTTTTTTTSTTTTTTTPPPAGPTIIGYLSNFDVPNETPEPEHGFEIEIEDISPDQVAYTYGNAHYGAGRTVTAATFSNGRSGVLIRYAATYTGGVWSATTPLHAVEHFGATLRAPAGVQRFNWLGEDPLHPGTLVRRGGTSTSGGAPTIPIPVPAPVISDGPGGLSVTQELDNSEIEVGEIIKPDSVWVRRYQSSINRNVTLDELMVNDPTIEDSRDNNELGGELELVGGGMSVSDDDVIDPTDCASLLTFDTYTYTGPVDAENEPTCDDLGGANDCTNFVGPRIATMMSAANLETPGG